MTAVVFVVLVIAGILMWNMRDGAADRGSRAIVCPHCQYRGYVTTRRVRRKRGVSGGKATAAVFTLGTSMLATGLSRKETVTAMKCKNCHSRWDV